MNSYGQIMDAAGILGLNEIVNRDGLKMDYDAWAAAGFCPTQGCVGEIVGDAYSAMGPLWILKCSSHVFVPVAQWAIREISEQEYHLKLSTSLALGRDPGGIQCQKQKQSAMHSVLQESIDNIINGIIW